MGLLSKFKERRAEAKHQRQIAEQREAEERSRQLAERRERDRQRRAEQSAVLAVLREDKVPDMPQWKGDREFKLAKNERMLWVFEDVSYVEQRTKRETRGKSAGTSIRVMKGVSVRAGQSAGRVVETDVLTSRGRGRMAVSTKHLFFVGDERTFRIRMDKIVSVRPAFGDAIEVTRDRTSGHPEFFGVGPEHQIFASELVGLVPTIDFGRGAPEMVEPDFAIYLPSDTGDGLLD